MWVLRGGLCVRAASFLGVVGLAGLEDAADPVEGFAHDGGDASRKIFDEGGAVGKICRVFLHGSGDGQDTNCRNRLIAIGLRGIQRLWHGCCERAGVLRGGNKGLRPTQSQPAMCVILL